MERLGWRIRVSTFIVLLWTLLAYAHLVGMPFRHTLAAGSIVFDTGFAYSTRVPPTKLTAVFGRVVDTLSNPHASRARLFENGVSLQPGHALHDEIRNGGQGRFSDWDGSLYFSASDNTDPRVNHRNYELRDHVVLAEKPLGVVSIFLAGALAGVWFTVFPWKKISVRICEIFKRRDVQRSLLTLVALSVGGIGLLAASINLYGVPFWLGLAVGLMLALLALRSLAILATTIGRLSWQFRWFGNVALILMSVGIFVVGVETYLAFLESTALRRNSIAAKEVSNPGRQFSDAQNKQHKVLAPTRDGRDVDDHPTIGGRAALPPELQDEMKRRRRLLSLPEEWQMKPVVVPNTRWAYSWHGVIHVHDENKFRRLNGPFPKKRLDTMRVMVVGDSMTYGAGIRAEWTYTAQLERALQEKYRIEFFNLGVNGDQSEDVKNNIERMIPILKPDLVIYGVCYNDFLPSGIGQYQHDYIFPLPKAFKVFMLKRSRIANLIDHAYGALLLKLGLSLDFYDDILRDFEGYQSRFARDVAQMSQVVRAAGLPPIVSMPLDQFVTVGGRGHKISQLAEKLMREAGFDVISLDGYYKRYDGKSFIVSRWEGHPDEEANAIFASMLYEHLSMRPDIQRYARDSSMAGIAK